MRLALRSALTILAAVLFALLALGSGHAAFGQNSGALIPWVPMTFPNALGTGPNVLGFVCSYAAGTTTPLVTYQNAALSVANQNPIRLNAAGHAVSGSTEVSIYLTPASYKFNIHALYTGAPVTPNCSTLAGVGALIRSVDNVYDLAQLLQGSGGSANIGFIQSGSGAVATTAQAKMRESLNVFDFLTATEIADIVSNTGSIDVSTHVQNAINTAKEVIFPYGKYKITTPLVLVSESTLTGYGQPTLTASVNGTQILSGTTVSNIIIRGIKFLGTSSSTVPLNMIGGQAATSTGLVTCNYCTNVRIYDNSFSTFYNGFTAIRNSQLWVQNNHVDHWYIYGILGSESYQFWIDHNHIIGADSVAVEAYGIMVTGDSTNAHPTSAGSISFNDIQDVPSWDGIMSHDNSGINIIGNDIRNVRICIDLGLGVTTGFLGKEAVSDNYCKSTTTNPWATTGQNHGGIIVSGLGTTEQVADITIANNRIDGFFNVSGLVISGTGDNIVCSYCTKASITGNVIVNSGSEQNNACIIVAGDANAVSINGNTCQGTFASGIIRFSAVVATSVSVCGNTGKATDTSNIGLFISNSTVLALNDCSNAFNSNAGSQYLFSSSTISLTGFFYASTTTVDPSNLATLEIYTAAVTCAGSVIGDFVQLSFDHDLQGITLTGYVSSANVVTAVFFNSTAGSIDLASGNLRVRTRPWGQ